MGRRSIGSTRQVSLTTPPLSFKVLLHLENAAQSSSETSTLPSFDRGASGDATGEAKCLITFLGYGILICFASTALSTKGKQEVLLTGWEPPLLDVNTIDINALFLNRWKLFTFSQNQEVREAPPKENLCSFGHCPNSHWTPPPSLKRALCGTYFRAKSCKCPFVHGHFF